MEGQSFSHYDVLERLGGGGMGAVYKALDTKLNRHVALKFLPQELTRDDEARQRFVQEAQSASALDHPNICTIHEIDSTPEGQMFITMAFYDGATLKKRIAQGPLPVAEALDIAIQMAQGLVKAHEQGIVHRDIKPANVMLTKDGFVKIVDFGIAKLLGVTGPTQVGSTLGTVSYMSPEQVAGEDADPRSDVWALGVVLYEMLTGQLPFPGESHWVVMSAIANRELEPLRSIRAEVPADVESVVMEALDKSRESRTRSADEMCTTLKDCRARLTGEASALAPAKGVWPTFLRPAVAVPVMGVMLVLGLWTARSVGRGGDSTWAREEAIPELLALIEQDDYVAAFDLAQQIEDVIPNDPVLAEAWTATSVTAAIVTEPAGADVYMKPYGAPDAEWRLLGQSPIESARVPLSAALQLRIEKDGFHPRVLASAVPGFYFGRVPAEAIVLSEDGSTPPEMVHVPGGSYPMRITGFTGGPIQLGPFLIDRDEVTNAEYKEFVDAGAYQDRQFWDGLEFMKDGARLSWEDAVAEFIDATGRPGPATWELGDFLEGRDDYPVTGVSWYEAVAFTRFRGKSLPTIYHWARAALASHNNSNSLGAAMLPLANFASDGPLPVGSSGAMGLHGTFDLAGNAKEWAWNASGEHHWLLGGAWPDEARMHSVRFTSPPFDRSPLHGFRGVKYLDEPPSDELLGAVDLLSRDYRNVQPVSDEVYQVYLNQMAYVPSELNARVEEVDESAEDWTREWVTIDAGYEDERLSLYLFLPKTAEPPYEALIFFYGLGPFVTPRPQHSSELLQLDGRLDGLVRSGRAFVIPIWNGSFERFDGFLQQSGAQYMRSYRVRMAEWAADLGRTIDYLETREDIRADRVAYVGVSFGSSSTLALLGIEERLKAALLLLPGYTYRDLPDEADPVNYVPRVTMPVLMIGGRYDYVFPVETAQQPLFDQFGTPPEHKRHLLYDMGHGPFPRGQLMRDVLPWLDEYLGPVN